MMQETWDLGKSRRWSFRISGVKPTLERRRFPISELMASAIRARGGETDRDLDRMYRDVQAAQDARESGR